jgi:hypothetical protein
MKFPFALIVLALSACSTVSGRHPPSIADPSPVLGNMTITAEELKQTGRPDIADALRAVSPIFH